LRYCRSRFFTFLFFMLKISRIRPCEYNKVVVFFTTVPTKFSLKFSECSTNFYAFYKIQPKGCTIEDTTLRLGPRKEMRAHNWVPRPWEAAGSPEIRRLWRRSRPGKGSGSRACSPRVGWRSWIGRRSCRRGFGDGRRRLLRRLGALARRGAQTTMRDPGRFYGS
jgi:hypothetical protein